MYLKTKNSEPYLDLAMIKFSFTIKLLSGDLDAWKAHDNVIRAIAKKHKGVYHLIEYSGKSRYIEATYPAIDNIIVAGMDIRNYFKELGIDQTMLDVQQEELKEQQLDTLKKLKEAVAL